LDRHCHAAGGQLGAQQFYLTDVDTVDDLLVLATDPDGLRRLHVFPQLTSRAIR
jgi:hypothetical protein